MGRRPAVKNVNPTFIRNTPHELSKLLKSLTKESPQAIEVLVALLKSTDERIRMQAADKLLSMQKDVAESVNRDALQRMIAQLRLGSNSNQNQEEEHYIGMQPVIDFETVQIIE